MGAHVGHGGKTIEQGKQDWEVELAEKQARNNIEEFVQATSTGKTAYSVQVNFRSEYGSPSDD
jgi:hypothetical protein